MRIQSFEDHREKIDHAARITPGIDVYCSSTDWIESATQAFHPEAELCLFQEQEALMPVARHLDASGLRLFAPAEGVWGLASPLLGPFDERPELALALVRQCAKTSPSPPFLMLAGLPAERRWVSQLIQGSTSLGTVGNGPSLTRRAASLAGGVDGYLGRRSRKHRASIRRSCKLVEGSGIVLCRHRPSTTADRASFRQQVMAVERASWKGISGQGAEAGPMRTFTEQLIERAGLMGRLRGILAVRDGTPVGYLYGAVLDREFRGIQMSFSESVRAAGLGNALQMEMIRWLCEDDVEVYDLGTDMPYKVRWAESSLTTRSVTIIAPELLRTVSPASSARRQTHRDKDSNRD